MSAVPFVPLGPPPLPPGWTEHTSPIGQVYYHNAQTQESTYTRPLPTFPIHPPPQPLPPPKRKKEKPLLKTPIPGTDWLRVKTTEGNIFYSNKLKKESVWSVPPEISEAVETLERDEREKDEQVAQTKMQLEEEEAERERLVEIERIKSEVQEMVKRKAQDEVSVEGATSSKRARIEDEEEEEEEESEEESWQREAAAQLAAEAEENQKREEAERERMKEEAEAEALKAKSAQQLNMPAKVDLSIDEAKALFKTLLREKDINPLHPWDTCLPLFVSDPRYVLLPSVSARRDAFDEYCRDRARELRRTAVKNEQDAANPAEEFDRLLREEVKSTRTGWNDFRRAWKKDRRFWGWGRDDREREKKFREFVKELGEKKREAAQKAEVDFFALLRERGLVEPYPPWRETKRQIYSDPRYDAVGSSSLREELYNAFLKAGASAPPLQPHPIATNAEASQSNQALPEADRATQEQKLKEKKDRAIREREMKVKTERGRVDMDIGRSKMGLSQEEGEQQFSTMLTDAVRDPQITWDSALSQLKNDPRFIHSTLLLNQQLQLFHTHVGQLRAKQLDALRSLFQKHAPSLATTFTSLPLPSLLSSLPTTKLQLDVHSLEQQFDVWQRERTNEARKAFDEMLTENAFIEFWGRLGKIGGKGVDGGISTDDIEEDGDKVDMKELAKTVDVQEIEKVLKNDKRYINFEHVPAQRERWIRDHLSRLSAPKLSVHLPIN